MFRHRPEYRFTGRVHETLDPEVIRRRADAFRAVRDVRIHHYGYMVDNPGLHHKKLRNQRLINLELEANPANPLVRFNLATECFRLGRDDEALSHYAEARKAGKDMPFLPHLVRNCVICHIRQGRLDEAKQEIWRGLADLPGFSELYYLFALICQMEGRFTQALQCFAECLYLGPPPLHFGALDGIGGCRAYLGLAHCYRMLDSPEPEARALLEAISCGAHDREHLDSIIKCLDRLKGESRNRLGTMISTIIKDPDTLRIVESRLRI